MSLVEVKNVTVEYVTGDLKDVGLKDVVIKKLKRQYKINKFLAVDGVSFTLDKGELLGIIGTNGAGKSTLLKVVTQIMRPTKGSVTVKGNIAALLELASGFDGDLTVEENTFLRGAMLGYTESFMKSKYKEIIEFAELTGFDDRPFKQLSSGMKSRLAFSIACLVKPDILILDEVLSVGDGSFRVKSEKKMREIINSGIATILVSHSLEQIRRMATKVLWLDHGKQIMCGETNRVCDLYDEYLRTRVLPDLHQGQKNAVGIAAGGSGTRLGGDIPKQFQIIGDKPVIAVTVERFLKAEDIDKIVIAVSEDYVEYTKKMMSEFFPDETCISVIKGGTDRSGTITEIVNYLKGECGYTENDIVITHDAVRPFVTCDIIKRNIAAAEKFGACTTAVAATDTMAFATESGFAGDVPKRERMLNIQTPQTFRIGIYEKAVSSLNSNALKSFTDICGIIKAAGSDVKIVNGSVNNFKITYKQDLEAAEKQLENENKSLAEEKNSEDEKNP